MTNIIEKISNKVFKGVWKKETTKTDHTLFRLHYKLSVVIILITILMYSLIVYKIQNISCIFPPKTKLGVAEDINTICWVLSVYTLTNNLDLHKGKGSITDLRPGVRGLYEESETVRYHTYYHGVPYILLVQLILFVTPRYFWYSYEDGKMKMMATDMQGYGVSKDKKGKRIKMLGEYFIASLHHNNNYGYVFAFCELLNLVTVFIQMHFLDVVTGYVFSGYGPEVLEFTMQTQTLRVDPMAKAFPVLGKCTFATYGPGGNIVPHSGICALPLNLTSERYFVFMWFYLLVLAILDVLNVSFRLVTIMSRSFRTYLLYNRAYFTPRERIKEIIENCQYGDWFILYQLGVNFDAPTYFDFLVEISERMKECKDA